MKRVFVLTISLLLVSAVGLSAQVTEEWVARYNGPGNGWDVASSIAVDGSGNVYVTGWSTGSGTGYDYGTIKYNSTGIQEWVARYDGPANYEDHAKAIAVDDAGNVYVTGHSAGSGTSSDYATVKYNPAGIEQWVVRYDAASAYAIALDDSGNVYVTGWSVGSGTSSDYATIKYNSAGIEQWVARYNGPANDFDVALSTTLDGSGNVYVTGGSEGSGTDLDYATVKYSSSGVQQWVARYNGPAGGDDLAFAMGVDGSGNVYVTGKSDGSGGIEDYATVKYNPAGNQQWVARYDGPGNNLDAAQAIAVDGSGNAYVTGTSIGSSGDWDYATVKYNSAGIEQWVMRYNGPGNSFDLAYAIALDGAGNVYVTGNSIGSGTDYDYATVKYNTSGVEQWVARYDGPASGYDYARAIAVDDAGNVYVTGNSEGSGTGYDYATIKYSQVAGVAEEAEPSLFTVSASLNRLSYNLPGQALLSVYSADGQKVLEETVKGMGIWKAPVELTQGVYFCRMVAGSFTATRKLILLR